MHTKYVYKLWSCIFDWIKWNCAYIYVVNFYLVCWPSKRIYLSIELANEFAVSKKTVMHISIARPASKFTEWFKDHHENHLNENTWCFVRVWLICDYKVAFVVYTQNDPIYHVCIQSLAHVCVHSSALMLGRKAKKKTAHKTHACTVSNSRWYRFSHYRRTGELYLYLPTA